MNTGPAELSNPATCRVVVVDDHAIMRDGLCAILNGEPNVEVVGTANDGKSAIQVVGQLLPDIVLMDLSMPRTNGSEAISVIKRRYPDVRVIVLTFHKEDAYIHAAIEAGANAYVLKGDGRDELLASLRSVDAVVIFVEDTPLELIRELRPHVLVKGADYKRETVVGSDLVKEWDGQVVLIELVKDQSTTNTIERLRALEARESARRGQRSSGSRSWR